MPETSLRNDEQIRRNIELAYIGLPKTSASTASVSIGEQPLSERSERIPEVPATRIITSASAQTPKTPPQHKKSPTEQKFSGVLKFAFDCEFALTDRFKPR